jgi:hypothetical protein
MMELPGFWNGSMAFGNAVFLEVPFETVNSLKTVDNRGDLNDHIPIENDSVDLSIYLYYRGAPPCMQSKSHA